VVVEGDHPSSPNRRVRGLPTSCISAANRETKSGPPPRSLLEVDRLLEHGQGVLVDVLVAVVLVALERQGRQLGSTCSASPVSHEQAQAAHGSGASTSLTSSFADALGREIVIRSAIADIAATRPGPR
jgi:hypothetical protein